MSKIIFVIMFFPIQTTGAFFQHGMASFIG
jgi:hypothetical protein